MARKARVRFEGAIYHVINRGLDRRELFWDAADYEAFLDGLEIGVQRFHARVYAYSLMPNHFHLLVETPLGNVDRFMQGVQTRYAGTFNRRHRRSGYVYQGPYRAKLVEGDEYLLRLSRYIHLNAVRTKAHTGQPIKTVVQALRAYPWSSYPQYIGRVARKEWIDYTPVEAHVRSLSGKGPGRYRRYIESGLAETDEKLEVLLEGSATCIGSHEYQQELQEKLVRRKGMPAQGYRAAGRFLPAEEILAEVYRSLKMEPEDLQKYRGGGWLRGVAAEMLCTYGGLTLSAAAKQLGMGTPAAVSIRRRELRRLREEDRRMNARLDAVQAKLRSRMSSP